MFPSALTSTDTTKRNAGMLLLLHPCPARLAGRRGSCFCSPWVHTRGMNEDVRVLVAEQIAYYRDRAPEYDDAYLGRDWGWVHRGAAHHRGRAGAGLWHRHWTPLLAARARSVTAVDAAPEVLACPSPPARPGAAGRVHRGRRVHLAAATPIRHGVLRLLAHPCAPGTTRGLLVDGRGRPWHRADRPALSTTPTESSLTNVSSLVRRRRPSGAGCMTAASIGWLRSTTRRVSCGRQAGRAGLGGGDP